MNDNLTLTKDQFDIIMKEVVKNHRLGAKIPISDVDRRKRDKSITYVVPSWDMRDLRCFHVKIGRRDFDYRDSDDPMFDRIMEWLNTPREEL